VLKLLAGLRGVHALVARGEPLPPFDYQCPLLSLPLAFRTGLQTIPSPTAYLSCDPVKRSQWVARLGPGTRARVGLVWRGNPDHKGDYLRSIALAHLVQHLPSGFQYVSLQKELADADRPAFERSPLAILDVASGLHDFSDTAALCDCLDLVISVDTSVAHLSAALGRKTWVLLPAAPDWRWLLNRQDSPWYPTIRLYRQENQGDWSRVLQRLSADLAHLFGAGGATV
jgi:hypothetical protein